MPQPPQQQQQPADYNHRQLQQEHTSEVAGRCAGKESLGSVRGVYVLELNGGGIYVGNTMNTMIYYQTNMRWIYGSGLNGGGVHAGKSEDISKRIEQQKACGAKASKWVHKQGGVKRCVASKVLFLRKFTRCRSIQNNVRGSPVQFVLRLVESRG